MPPLAFEKAVQYQLVPSDSTSKRSPTSEALETKFSVSMLVMATNSPTISRNVHCNMLSPPLVVLMYAPLVGAVLTMNLNRNPSAGAGSVEVNPPAKFR